MRLFKVLFLLLGVLILGVVVSETDLPRVAAQVAAVGWGIVWVLGLYFIAFAVDSWGWQLALPEAPLTPRWAYRFWKARMVGEVFNSILPAAGMGGEPIKALLLKKYYGLGYREIIASLILAKTINMAGLVAFLVIGFALAWASPVLPMGYKIIAAAGLGGLSIGIILFWAVQRFRWTSIAGTRIARWPIGQRLESVLHHIHDMDERLVTYYTRHRPRLWGALALAFLNWVLGVAEIWVAMVLLDHPVTWTEAWIIEAVTQLVRTGTFFIPASIGAQEGAFLVICQVLTGSPSLGLAVAVVRRLREVLWLLWGTGLGWMFARRTPLELDQDTGRP